MPSIDHFFRLMRSFHPEEQQIIHCQKVDSAIHEKRFGFKKKEEVSVVVYDKKIKADCVVLTTG